MSVNDDGNGHSVLLKNPGSDNSAHSNVPSGIRSRNAAVNHHCLGEIFRNLRRRLVSHAVLDSFAFGIAGIDTYRLHARRFKVRFHQKVECLARGCHSSGGIYARSEQKSEITGGHVLRPPLGAMQEFTQILIAPTFTRTTKPFLQKKYVTPSDNFCPPIYVYTVQSGYQMIFTQDLT